MKTVPFEPLDPALYREIVRRALAEDLGWGDVTTEATVDAGAARAAASSSPSATASSPASTSPPRRSASSIRACVFTATLADGDRCAPGDVVANVRGAAGAMLTAERTALNFLQRLSGIATLTRRFVDAAAGGDHRSSTRARRRRRCARSRSTRSAPAAAPTIAPASTTAS